MANGRVCTGFSKPYVALYQNTDGTVTYTSGQILARGVSVTVEPEASEDNRFYADNIEAENASGEFTGGTVTLTVDGLLTAAEKLIMGLPEADEKGWMAYGDEQKIPPVGVGYIVRYKSSGADKYVPTVLTKLMFATMSSDHATQEGEIDWQTQELTASIFRDDTEEHNWKFIGQEYETEGEAEAAIKEKLGITGTTGA